MMSAMTCRRNDEIKVLIISEILQFLRASRRRSAQFRPWNRLRCSISMIVGCAALVVKNQSRPVLPSRRNSQSNVCPRSSTMRFWRGSGMNGLAIVIPGDHPRQLICCKPKKPRQFVDQRHGCHRAGCHSVQERRDGGACAGRVHASHARGTGLALPQPGSDGIAGPRRNGDRLQGTPTVSGQAGCHQGDQARPRERGCIPGAVPPRGAHAREAATPVYRYGFRRLQGGRALLPGDGVCGRGEPAAASGHGSITQRDALDFVQQITEALQHAHEAGVVHRDIKPENVLLDSLGRLRLVDFGLATLFGPAGKNSVPTTTGWPARSATWLPNRSRCPRTSTTAPTSIPRESSSTRCSRASFPGPTVCPVAEGGHGSSSRPHRPPRHRARAGSSLPGSTPDASRHLEPVAHARIDDPHRETHSRSTCAGLRGVDRPRPDG